VQHFPLPADADYTYEAGFDPPRHEGVDILAPKGTPALACEGGKAWSNIEPKGGRVAYLQGDSGARYFYGHLDSWSLKLISATTQKPLRVEAGEALGTVGTSGNAEGRPAHIHFQMRRPGYFGDGAYSGTEIVDPFPELLEVDPHKRGLGRRAAAAQPTQLSQGLAVLAVLWMLFQATKGRRR